MGKKKREVELVVISDIHLGTYGCHAEELLRYLKTIKPKRLILNGDIIDIWQFSKRYWPKSHMQVVKHIMGLLAKLGAVGYDLLIHINSLVNFILKLFGRGKISLSKRVKDSVKQAVKFIN